MSAGVVSTNLDNGGVIVLEENDHGEGGGKEPERGEAEGSDGVRCRKADILLGDFVAIWKHQQEKL